MLLNDKKGWYGSFSSAGKGSADKYNVFKMKKNSKSQSNIFNPFEHKGLTGQANEIEDNIDIFRIESIDLLKENKNDTKTKSNIPLSTSNKNKKRNGIPEEKLYYHNKHVKEGTVIKKQYVPGCTKYNPRYNYILKRSASAPEWRTMTKRKDYIKKDETKFNIDPPNILNNKAGKAFVDMSKQTQRKIAEGFIQSRPQTTKPKRFDKENDINTSKSNITFGKLAAPISSKISRPSTAFKFSRKSTFRRSISQRSISAFTKKDNEEITTESVEDSYDEFRNIYMKQLKKKNKSFEKKSNEDKKGYVKGIDFTKVISREHLDKIEDKKKAVIPFSLPNFKQVRERPLSMVVYDRIHYKNTKTAEFKGIDMSVNYDPNKILHLVNNHTSVKPPNFNLMTSRPDDADPLPAYMKQIYSRASCYETTSLSLKMNNYANGKFLEPDTSFWPKKTYNKIINLNLLHSKKFLADAVGNAKAAGKKVDKIGKALRFYNKNYNDLLKDDLLSKFDGVTFKSNNRHNNLDVKDVESYLYSNS